MLTNAVSEREVGFVPDDSWTGGWLDVSVFVVFCLDHFPRGRAMVISPVDKIIDPWGKRCAAQLD